MLAKETIEQRGLFLPTRRTFCVSPEQAQPMMIIAMQMPLIVCYFVAGINCYRIARVASLEAMISAGIINRSTGCFR